MAINKNKINQAAQRYAEKKNFERAIEEYRKILDGDPDDIRTWLKIGDLYTRMGARSEATDTYLKVAEKYKGGGFHLKAVAVYKQIIKLDPLFIDVYDLLGEAYLSLGLTSEALVQFEQLVDIAEKQKKNSIALNAMLRVVELDESNVTMRLRLGERLFADGNEKEGVNQFLQACKKLKEMERTEDFLKVAERLLQRDDSQVELAREVALLYLERNQPKRALGKLQILFSKNRRDASTLELLARAFLELGQAEKAVSVYSELISIAKEKENYEDRDRYCNSILALDANNEEAKRELASSGSKGSSATKQGASEATASEAASAGEDPAVQGIIDKLTQELEVLLKYGLIERAKAHFDRIFSIDYYNLDARERFKDVLFESGDTEGAKEQLFILVEGFVESQPEGAVYYLHRILEIDPYSRRARDMLVSIGGVMPEGLPSLNEEQTTDDSGLLGVEEIEVEEVSTVANHPEDADAKASATRVETDNEDFQVTIEEIPYVEDDSDLEEELLDGEDSDDMPLGQVESAETEEKSPSSLPRPSVAPGGLSIPPPRPGTSSFPPQSPAGTIGAGLPRPSMLPASVPSPEPYETDGESGTASRDVDISEEIEEIEFFLEQGLDDEARAVFEDLLKQYPDDPALVKIKPRFSQSAQEITHDSTVTTDSDIDLDELSAALKLEDLAGDHGPVEVEEVFSQFKTGVEEQISKSDYDTHFDLGQAYKDMGLWDDAIKEFKLATGDSSRRTASEMMVGMCHVGAGRFEDAISTFDVALESEKLKESEKLALLYEKGKVFELMNQSENALNIYNKILNIDPGFADVVDRIDSLE